MPRENNLTFVTKIDPATEEMVPAKGRRKVFVSYKKDDNRMSGIRDIVIKKTLRMRDCAVWYDDNLTPGVDYDDEIIDAISKCDAMILILTANILQSSYVWDIEVATAIEQKKGIIPIAFDISPDDYAKVEKRLGHTQILRWPVTSGEIGGISEDAVKFDDAFKNALDRFVMD
ncbi:MAG: toll/interleukin-1 receptor domain-containing protein, partial [Clostridia bacterium]|nr:toll/interleukin-1 receptor domain-containing protein [Clostridia bacterium]